MNQPSTTCVSWINKLSQAYWHNSYYSYAPTRSHAQTTARYQPYLDHDVIPEDDDARGGFAVDEDFAYNPDDGQQEDVPGLVINAHPSTPSIYPGGTTFMDQFFTDQYADFRRENLYYPFASRIDWQLTSWLLRSRLSMAAIDNFLSLELVCRFFLLLL